MSSLKKSRPSFERLEFREVPATTPLLVVNPQTNAIFLSPDDKNLTGGGQTTQVYNGASGAVSLNPVRSGGVLTEINSSHAVFFSPDYKNLVGGGQTQQVYNGSQGDVKLYPVKGGGVLVQVLQSKKVFYSPDLKNLTGGGLTFEVYNGSEAIHLTPLPKVGVLVTIPSSKTILLSEDYKNLGTVAGKTTRVYDGSQGAARILAVPTAGVLVQFPASTSPNKVFFSPDFKNLSGGGQTTEVYNGTLGAVKLTTLRGGGILTEIDSTNAVFYSPDFKNLTGGGQTLRVYDGGSASLDLAVSKEGVLAERSDNHQVFLSTDFKNLGGVAGNTSRVYDGSRGDVAFSWLRYGGVLTKVVSSGAIFHSPDSKNLIGGGATVQVHSGTPVVTVAPVYVAPAFIGPVYTTKTSGLKVRDIKVGTGTVAKKNDQLRVHYTGMFLDGTKFDSSVDRNQPFDLKLGQTPAQVIQGWEEGILGMQVGGKRQLIVPPDLAYGTGGSGSIPSNATLYFEIEMLSIVSA